ncbi:bactofilin family protein [Wenzhouxiangella sediminis]|uniref:Polymer-forming cytoskeletal protein n=1 Tax=Wenzhouxiangella sediminis TaxID=1792836 RepID=A0A3E1K915_9GAMM|nr:polymer-forming cytoskeletal protein [Wenzhouxiangella sediminis]RFF30595.1 polymer-forming cytoskeletal protein [Wenzhouxiangella sediminis]
MFNKRDQHESEATAGASRSSETASAPRPAPRSSSGTAMIGPSINVDGKLRGEEDLVIEGKVKGTVELKNNSVTIGSQGDVAADIYAHSIFVDGTMDGNLVASEQVVIRKSARVKGSIAAPRVSLEDGAQFNGSIDMDAKGETLSKAFSGQKSASGSSAGAKTESPHSDTGAGKTGSEAGKQVSH